MKQTMKRALSLALALAMSAALLLPTDRFFAHCPAYTLSLPRQEKLCRNGNPVPAKGLAEGGLYRVYGPDGAFLCLSRWEAGVLTSEKNFFGA